MPASFEEISVMADKLKDNRKGQLLSDEEYRKRKEAVSFAIASGELEGASMPEDAKLLFARYLVGETDLETVMKEVL